MNRIGLHCQLVAYQQQVETVWDFLDDMGLTCGAELNIYDMQWVYTLTFEPDAASLFRLRFPDLVIGATKAW